MSLIDRWQWLKAIGSNDGPSSPIARLVAHTLALHMKADLADCYPSQPMIAREACLSEKSVQRAIKALVAGGWLEVAKVKTDGRVWCKSVYLARLPDSQSTSQSVTPRNGHDRSQSPVVPVTESTTSGLTVHHDRSQSPTNQIPNQISKQISKRIRKQEEDDLRKSQEKDQEVLREKDREKIRKAAEAIGVPSMPLGAARQLWVEQVSKLTWIKPDRVCSLMAEKESNRRVS